MAKIHDMMTEINCKIIAEEIAITFTEQACQNNVEYQWTIQKEDGQISNRNANTSFCFDPDESTLLNEFKEALYSKELKEIEEGTLQEENLMKTVGEFLKNISIELTGTYKEDLQEVIRRVVLGNKSDPKTLPLDTIEVLSIDIADYSSIAESEKSLLKVFKSYGAEISIDEIVQFVHEKQEETGEDLDTILALEKQYGNPLFADVTSLQKGDRFLNEVTLSLFVDYSMVREGMDSATGGKQNSKI